ncbi:Methyltransferase-like protein 7B [Tolypocladium ophioglossoides CBS 100239]|uniref:Methyltransferase-like protein 7B n=1 Tax=Tolypocladium ophioglossoides (strain CBS 100239) TaxID=1163406 RepID=A0A0L0N1C1_TOLOC|nr:Methyltransferase-like protein 7B [Tolypocladium ophioglossoides CBS 100239]
MAWQIKDRFCSYIEPLERLPDAIWDDDFIRFEQDWTTVPKLVSEASGVVLELGPGLGNQLRRFDKTSVTRIIGVESNAHFSPDIQRQIQEQGLDHIYELLMCGVEDGSALERHGIVADSLDTVLSIQVLCSVPDPEATVKELYRLLKPGGKLIFWEHHRNSDWLTAAVQCKPDTKHSAAHREGKVTDGIADVWNPIWKSLIGGCNMTRSMRAIVATAGEWENLDSIEGDELPSSMLPRVWGVLVKPKQT